MRRTLAFALCTFVLLTGCNPTSVPDTTDFGRFEGDIVASWAENGRDMVLKDSFRYVDGSNREWTAPAGAVVNGASIPSAFWSVIGGPFEGKYRNASVVHDVGCEEMLASWEDVHMMFYEACRCGGVDDNQAKLMYYAVYHFGPRWEPIVETVAQPVDNGNGQTVMRNVNVQRVARIDPPPPTIEEVQQVEAFVAEENPQPEAIRRLNRDQLRRRGDRSNRNDQSQSRSRDFAKRWDDQNRSARSQNLGTQSRSRSQSGLQPETEEAVIARVRNHVEQQAGELRPAVYTVQPGRNSYRVEVQYVHEDEQGQVVADPGCKSTAIVSSEGKLVEFVSGNGV
ncbi:DUF1353 domain-containing protein [Allorhodopirellula solitaria]|uniref:DUF1353 domain-containing protein n=1 Tax=Allorhodopirellula solitaria TaxID=2527987 RepID=A0A5C5X169_9BACT|nr:DUF1353 domain-containing protein [Allorhodopirellula solitaria]TWT56349.1 hypothetical protein CA85_43520 [Allorhodopirellula solitaria]